MNGLSERLLVSHYVNNYGGALQNARAIGGCDDSQLHPQLGFRRAGLQACLTRKGPLARPTSFTWRFVRIGRSPDVWVFGHVGGNDVDHSQEVLEGRHLGAVEPVVDGAGLHAELLRKSVDVSESGNRKVERLSKDAAHDVGIVG